MYGGDSSSVQDQLQNVQHICGTLHAFAAILADGSVVTWGNQANMVVTAPESNVSLCTSRNLGACQGKNYSTSCDPHHDMSGRIFGHIFSIF